MKIRPILLLLFLLTSSAVFSQVVLSPENPPVDKEVTVHFYADKGNAALQGLTGDVYLHTGVITNKSIDGHDWKYVVGNWGTEDKRVLMKREGPDHYTFTLTIKSFYNLGPDDVAQQLAFVFRNADGTLVGKTIDNEDITVPVNGYKPAKALTTERIFVQRELTSVVAQANGWELTTDNGIVTVTAFNNDIAEVYFSDNENEKPDFSHSVVMQPENVIISTKQINNGWILKAGNLTIHVNEKPFNISFERNGNQFLGEKEGFYFEQGNRGIRFNLKPGEKIYGTGERAVNINRRGYRFALYNRPFYGYELGATMLNYSMPLTFSSEKYALLFDNPQKGYVDIGKTEKDVMEWGTLGGTLRYYVITGNDWNEISANYTTLTGRQQLPPRWAFGNLQSRMAYRNQQEADSIVTLMKKNHFPIDALILDFYWFGDSIQGYLGKLDWYKKAWPEPEKMIQKFKNQGVKTILITEPYVIDSLSTHAEADAKGVFVTDSLGKTYLDKQFYFGTGSLIDIFKPEARNWFWSKYQKQIGKGIAGWWGDLGEPESHPSDIRHVNGKADEVHNIYGHYWDKMLFDRYAEEYPEVRLFHLQRSGFAGTQRYSAFPWTGDVSRSWGGLQAQLPLLLTMSMSGLGYIHSDAGGFAQGVRDDELYTRWLQFAVFTPILRPHGSNHPSEPVFWSKQTQDIVRRYMNLRYSLLPYNYSLAYKNSTEGTPLMQPMFYAFPNDSTTYSLQNQYMWGSSILVAPVIEKGLKSLKIYLPEGKWFDMNLDNAFDGKQWIEYPLTIENIPVFIKAGSFIPFVADTLSSTDYYKPNNYTVWYFPSGKTVYEQFEDDGHSNKSIQNNQFELIHYEGETVGNLINVKISRKGSFAQMPSKQQSTLAIPLLKVPKMVILNGKNVIKNSVIKSKQISYDGHWLRINLTLTDAQTEISITQ